MKRAYKTELNPSKEQIIKIKKTLGTCRFIYNFYIAKNKELFNYKKSLKKELDKAKLNLFMSKLPLKDKTPTVHSDATPIVYSNAISKSTELSTEVFNSTYETHIKDLEEKYNNAPGFMNANTFSKWLNNEFLPNNESYSWIKEVSSKAIKQSLRNGEKAYNNFFKGKNGFPKFKKKSQNEASFYFVNQCNKAKLKSGIVNYNYTVEVERHRVKVPTLGFIKLKEKGYIPSGVDAISGTITYKAGRYFISILMDKDNENQVNLNPKSEGIGIDLGIKALAILSNETIFKNINKSSKIKKLEKKLKREQRSLSRMLKNKKHRKGGSSKNIAKKILVIEKLHMRLFNIRTDYINKVINEIIKLNPKFITIEDLNIKGLMKNHHLARHLANQKLGEFINKLTLKCNEFAIELRQVSRWYPSSKTCSKCGSIKKDLKLSDRIYICLNCGNIIDRDLNAALNLRDSTKYEVITT